MAKRKHPFPRFINNIVVIASSSRITEADLIFKELCQFIQLVAVKVIPSI